MYGKFLATISKVAKLQTFLLTKNRSRVWFQICPNSKTSGKLIKAAKPRFRSNPTLGQAIPAPDFGHCSTGARGAWAPGPSQSPARPGLSKPSARPDSDVPGLGQRYPVFDRARLPCKVRATHNFVQPPKTISGRYSKWWIGVLLFFTMWGICDSSSLEFHHLITLWPCRGQLEILVCL